MRETVLKWGSQSTTWLYLLLAYPVIDFVLRKILPIPVVSSFWDEALLLILLGFTFFAFISGTRTMPAIKHLLVAFLVLGIALTVTDMSNWDASVEGFRSVYQYILAFLMGFYLLQSMEQLDRLMKVLALVGFLAALVGVAQVVLGVKTPESWVQEGEAVTTRAFSFVTSPNVLGSYMALIAPVAAGLFMKAKSLKEKGLWAIVTVVTILAMLLTGSRGAWFALAFSVFICCYIWKRKVALFLVLIGIIGAVVLYFVPETVPVVGKISNRIFTLFTKDYFESSMNGGRLGRWGEAYDKMRVEPLFGVGLGHHGGAVASRHFGTIYSDSYFFKSLAEYGLIGIIMLLGLVGQMLRYAIKAIRGMTGSPYFFPLLGLFGGLFAVALHNLVENIFEVPFMALYFWLFGGFLCALYVDQKQTKRW
ncbi:O-antigen ligase family protein [Brevibacillus brevis]|uniref:O-antigen ligase family protein n=1 Tax=Brevibacillus brevis TaxID=1393 RepID=A0ABY9T8X1_BREBE|nr:O-antigen ligase family protein [Brevibacillus brevis]WNC16554.1 O-antigen ligase family protein [Brevibacillus brevis]